MGKTPLRILCFGDSLTAGFPESQPYALKLGLDLEAAFPSLDVHCDVRGVPGDLASMTYADRMSDSWTRNTYDWAIVLGGTNDLGFGLEPPQIIEALERTWEVVLSRGGKVLALTIPEVGGRWVSNMERTNKGRSEVNAAIAAYNKNGFHVFDLFSEFPYNGMDSADRDKYWYPDGVHLTEYGYDLMGEKIAQALIKIVSLEEAQATDISSVVGDARQQKLIEEMIVEEEIGDPKLLSQGYIVVRKRDLH